MRCYVDESRWSPDTIELIDEEAHHLAHVMRAKIGQQVTVTDGMGHEALTEVSGISRHQALLSVLHQTLVPRLTPRLFLIQSLPREQKLDFVIQKATELGIDEIIPVIADHSVARIRSGQEDAKRERWTKVAVNAIKQCGGSWLPEIRPVTPILDAISNLDTGSTLLTCSLQPDVIPLKSAIESIKALRPSAITIAVGPEGDFSSRELAALRNAGARMISLGDRILRAETASLFIASVLHYEFRME